MSDIRVLCIIVNYKTPDLVKEAIKSLIPDLDISKDKIVVIDNNSNDNSEFILTQAIVNNNWIDFVYLINAKKNGGFSYGNNLGILSNEAEFYFLLNSDAYIRKNALIELLNSIKTNEKVGIISPRLEYENGIAQDSCFLNVTPWHELMKSAASSPIDKILNYFGIHKTGLISNIMFSPEWVSFACVLIRKDVIKTVGLMDDSFFMYKEDNDYCRRVRKAGWDILFCPKARVVHLNKGYSDTRIVKKLPNFYYQSRTRYFLKYYGRLGLLAANILWTIGRIIHLFREIIERKPAVVHSSAWKSIWIDFFIKLK